MILRNNRQIESNTISDTKLGISAVRKENRKNQEQMCGHDRGCALEGTPDPSLESDPQKGSPANLRQLRGCYMHLDRKHRSKAPKLSRTQT